MPRTIISATGASVPWWSWEIPTALKIHGSLSNRDLAALLGKPEPRVSETVRKLRMANLLKTSKRGKEVIISLH